MVKEKEQFGTRQVLKISAAKNILLIFKDAKNNNAEITIQAGDTAVTGIINSVQELFITLEMPDKPETFWEDPSFHGMWIYGRFQLLKKFITFDTYLDDISESTQETGKFIWKLEIPKAVQSSNARPQRIRPISPIRLEIPTFSPSRLKSEVRTFINATDYYTLLRKIDNNIISDTFDDTQIFSIISQTLKKLSGQSASAEKRFQLVLRGQNENPNTEQEIWLENTQRPNIEPHKRLMYKEKNIGSIVLAGIVDQLNHNWGHIICTRSLEQPGFTIVDRDFIKALGTRILAAYKKKKGVRLIFPIENISEEGVFITKNIGEFETLTPGTIIHDIKLYFDHAMEKNILTVNALLKRHLNNGLALHLLYSDPATRTKIRQFVGSTARINAQLNQ